MKAWKTAFCSQILGGAGTSFNLIMDFLSFHLTNTLTHFKAN